MAQWIWRYGDYEIYHSLLLHARREEFGADYPAIWHTDAPEKTVSFFREFETEKPCWMRLTPCGKGSLVVDGKRFPSGEKVDIPAGKHSVSARIVNVEGLPAAYVDSDICPSDGEWTCGIRERGGCEKVGTNGWYTDPDETPEIFPFRYEEIKPVSKETVNGGILYDFGRETFARITLCGCAEDEEILLVYGESREEALDPENAVIRQHRKGKTDYELHARALRYLFVSGPEKTVRAEFEYLPLEKRGSFHSGDELMNRIWETSAYTFLLNSREFFLDGIKRDRWVWSGDAYQSYMVNAYLFFDKAIAERTMLALRGRDEMPEHINTILDYSLYWLISIADHYRFYGDREFLIRMLPRMRSLLKYVEKDTDENGFITGGEGAWIFIDWSEMDKEGPISAEQLLYIRALEAMAECEEAAGNDASALCEKAGAFLRKVDEFYWDAEKGAYIDSFASGKRHVTRHANLFAVIFGLADEEKTASIVKNVILNDAVTQITTPYFKFFEMDALCRLGFMEKVAERIKAYWGGMLALGATSIWEQFDPEKTGVERYAMYGNAYGCSLCHAWGAGPVYLMGRYYLGVRPVKPGYEEYIVEPCTEGLGDIEGSVPTPKGDIRVKVCGDSASAYAPFGGGTLVWKGKMKIVKAGEWTTIP
ncbi:MAG: alpha-rhamnosidase [Clostridia bacterium]|nr:alpha-rhamnosidase [Clostridia bacterium]